MTVSEQQAGDKKRSEGERDETKNVKVRILYKRGCTPAINRVLGEDSPKKIKVVQ